MPNETRLEPPDGFGDVAPLKCLDCAALEKENKLLKVELELSAKFAAEGLAKIQDAVGLLPEDYDLEVDEYTDVANTITSLLSCHGEYCSKDKIESLTAQLAEAREAMEKAADLVSCESIEPCKGSIRCNGCEAKFILKAAIEAAGGVE
jgi:hypothetical protein